MCPTCGSCIEKKFLVDFASNTFITSTAKVQLTKAETDVLGLIAEVYPSVISVGRIIERRYGWQNEPDDPLAATYVHIARIRKKIAPCLFDIENVYGSGYRLIRIFKHATKNQ